MKNVSSVLLFPLMSTSGFFFVMVRVAKEFSMPPWFLKQDCSAYRQKAPNLEGQKLENVVKFES